MIKDLSSLIEASASVTGLESDYYGISKKSIPTLHVVRALNLLTMVSAVKSLSLDQNFMHVLHFANDDLPIFHNLACLKVVFEEEYGWKVLPDLLKVSPNLEKFIIEQGAWISSINNWGFVIGLDPPSGDGFIWCEPYLVPCCLSLHLQAIELTGLEGYEDELKMVEYLLGKAKVVKLFTINTSYLVLKFPRDSRNCCVEFNGDFFSKF